MSDIELDVAVKGDEAAKAKIHQLTQQLLSLKKSGKAVEKLSSGFKELKENLNLSGDEAAALEHGLSVSIDHLQSLADKAVESLNNVSYPKTPASDTDLQNSFVTLLSLRERLNDAETEYAGHLGDLARGELNLNEASKRVVETNKEIFSVRSQIKDLVTDLNERYGPEYIQKIVSSTGQLVGAEKQYTAEKRAQIPTMDRFLRRWRWSQSLVLVTLNFLSRLGGQSKVLGGILMMLGTGFGVILNSILKPTIPFFVWLMEKMIGLAGWIDELNDKYGYLGTILSGIIVFIGSLVGGRIVGWIVSLISKVFLFGGAIDFLKETVGKLGLKFAWLKDKAKIVIDVLKKLGGLTFTVLRLALGYVKTALKKVGTVLIESVLPALKRFLFRSVACAGGITVLELACAALAGLLLGGIVVWGLWKIGALDAITGAGKAFGRWYTNAKTITNNLVKKFQSAFEILTLLAKQFALGIAVSFANVMKDIPIIGAWATEDLIGGLESQLAAIPDKLEAARERLSHGLQEGVILKWGDEGEPVKDKSGISDLIAMLDNAFFVDLLGMTGESTSSLNSINNQVASISDGLNRSAIPDSELINDFYDGVERFDTGGTISRTGLAVVHKGETIVPATGTHGGASAGTTVHINNPRFVVKRDDDKELFRRFMDMLRVQGGVALR